MLIELTVEREYHFDIEVSARFVEGRVEFRAVVDGNAMISHFDDRADYVGASVEEALSKIGSALQQSIEALRAH